MGLGLFKKSAKSNDFANRIFNLVKPLDFATFTMRSIRVFKKTAFTQTLCPI